LPPLVVVPATVTVFVTVFVPHPAETTTTAVAARSAPRM
jgi:hypothetical protein